MTPLLPSGGRVVAYVVGLEMYGKRSGIKRVDYARRDAEAFADAVGILFPGRTVELDLRIDDEATLSSLKYELPQTIAGLGKDDLFILYYAGHGFYGEGGNRLTAFDSSVRNLDGTTWLLRELVTDPLERSACRRALIFIDACAEQLEVSGRSWSSRSIRASSPPSRTPASTPCSCPASRARNPTPARLSSTASGRIFC